MARKKDKEKEGVGRPRKEIDRMQFEELCRMQCTQKEMCAVLQCTDKTLNAWCKDEYGETLGKISKIYRQEGMASLKRAQWIKAMAQGDNTMMIWLGKQYLGQQENPQLIKLKEKELDIKMKELELKEKLIDAQLYEWDDEEDKEENETVIRVVRGSEVRRND